MKIPESIIYMAQCKIKRELIYIGKTHQNTLEERIDQHENSARKGDPSPFHQALIDYGLKNWEWNIIAKCPIEKEFEKEKELIEKFGAAPIDLLNVTYGQKKQEKKTVYSKKIIERTRGNKFHSTKKSELGKMFLRQSGKIKPIINLKTKVVYESETKASELENVSRSTIRLSCSTGKMIADGTRYAYLDIEDNPILTEGHSKNQYIGQRKSSKKIKNLINGKIYNNISEVVNEYNISSSCADGAARGNYMTAKNKWVFCFLDENGKEIITERHKKGLKKIQNQDAIKYVVWHIDDVSLKDKLYFKTLDEICIKLDISGKSHIKGVCDGKRAHVQKWRIAYFDNQTKQPILTEKHKNAPRKVIRKIICLNDKKVFSSGVEAGIYYKLNPQQITKCAKGEAKSVYCMNDRLRFAFIDDNGKPILTPKHSEPLAARGKSRIQLIKTGKVYNSLAEFIRETGIPYKTAKRYIKNPAINLFGYEFIELD